MLALSVIAGTLVGVAAKTNIVKDIVFCCSPPPPCEQFPEPCQEPGGSNNGGN